MGVLKISISVLYIIAGFSACGAFLLLNNYPSAVLANITGIMNLILCCLHCLDHRNQLYDFYAREQLKTISFFGFSVFAISVSIFFYFLAIEIFEKRPILPIETSAIVSLIWAFMCMKSGLMLSYFGRYYSREEPDDSPALIEQSSTEDNEDLNVINP